MSQGFAREARIGVDLHVGETLYYTSNDSFAKADYDGLYGVRVQAVGGGGAGGGAPATGSTQVAIGGGGGGGACASSIILAADLGISETITIGTGGSGSTGAGGDGNDTSFGTHVVAAGGDGGGSSGAAGLPQSATAGIGGLAVNSTGDVIAEGSGGLAAIDETDTARVMSGAGGAGAGPYGGGGGRSFAGFTGSGNGGGDYGGGGGGAGNGRDRSASNGGNGADGIVVVEVLYERKIAVDEDIHPQYLNETRHNNAHSAARRERGTSAQTITRASFTVVDYNTDVREDDTDGDFTWDGVNFQWDINNAGWYEVTAGVYMQTATTYQRLVLQVRHNGTGVARGDHGGPGNAQNVTTMIYASASDTIDFRVYHDNTGTADKDLLADAQSFCTIKKVRE